ncbi:Mitochondrial translocator assembly and maintenance protein 41 [Thecaphora frezii]|nr:putative mmp37-domain-containing protein [Thecaphora frezii]
MSLFPAPTLHAHPQSPIRLVLVLPHLSPRPRLSPTSTTRLSSSSPSAARAFSTTPHSPQVPANSPQTSRFRTPSFPPPSFPAVFGANQILPLDPGVQRRLDSVLHSFHAPIRFAFAYGSGVFSQSQAGPEHSKKPSTRDGRKMVDFIFAVTHPKHWHALNMAQNPRHYSLLSRLLGSSLAAYVQRRGAGLWYHPYVTIHHELVKYGVISIEDLCDDLLDWRTLYVSGRMHKPVALLTSDARVRLAQQVNLASALRVALLLLPQQFTEVELYTRIASLSYTGDFRMSVPGGENADKVRNIVLNQREEFRRLYAGLIRSLGTVQVQEMRENRFSIMQDTSTETRALHASKLPRNLRRLIQEHYTSRPELDAAFLALSQSDEGQQQVARTPSPIEAEEVQRAFWRAAVARDDFQQVLLDKIAETVRGPAWSQSLKGIYTAGFTRTAKYIVAKVGKYFEGRRERKQKAQ